MLLGAAMKLLLKQHSCTTLARLIHQTAAPKSDVFVGHTSRLSCCFRAAPSEGLKTAPVLVLNINNHRLNLGLPHCCLVVVAAHP